MAQLIGRSVCDPKIPRFQNPTITMHVDGESQPGTTICENSQYERFTALWDRTAWLWDIKITLSHELGSEWVSGASERANGQASGPVLTSRSLVFLTHRAPCVDPSHIFTIARLKKWIYVGTSVCFNRFLSHHVHCWIILCLSTSNENLNIKRNNHQQQ